LQHLLDRFGRVDHFEATPQGVQFLLMAHQHPDAHGAEVGDAGQVQPKPVRTAPDELAQFGGQVIRPVAVDPAPDLELGGLAGLWWYDDFDRTAPGAARPLTPSTAPPPGFLVPTLRVGTRRFPPQAADAPPRLTAPRSCPSRAGAARPSRPRRRPPCG